MRPELEVSTTRQGGAAVVAPRGEVDMSTSPELRVALQAALTTDLEALVVDLSGVPSLDSSGVATLVEALRGSQNRGVPLALCNLAPRVSAVLEIARLDRVFTISGSVEEALEASRR